jgi:membrane protease YdiL (CAAX protease family)
VSWLLFTPGVYGVFLIAQLVWKAEKHPLEQMMRANATTPVFILAVVSGVILAPAVEELFFRGILQGWLTRVFAEPKPPAAQAALLLAEEPAADDLELRFDEPEADRRTPGRFRRELTRMLPNVITSILFAAVHIPQWPAPVAIFALSMVLGVLYQRTRSIAGPFVLHALFNGLSTVMLFGSLS